MHWRPNYYTAPMEQSNQIPPDDLSEIPLFPLNLVLFPGMRLPLHIFEERYKAMIGDCIEREAPFGVVLIKDGPEVGGPAEPHRVGTIARITQVQRLEEGRMNLQVLGEQRFDLLEIIQETPHMVGLVAYKRESAGEVPEILSTEVGKEYGQLLQNVSAMTGSWNAPVHVQEDPLELSFEALATLAISLQLPLDIRQQLLEYNTAAERLANMYPFLHRANELIQEQLVQNNPFKGARLN